MKNRKILRLSKRVFENGRNAIGIELNEEFYNRANEKLFSLWDDKVYESNDSIEKMKERFAEQLALGKEQSAKAKAEKEAKKAAREAKKKGAENAD